MKPRSDLRLRSALVTLALIIVTGFLLQQLTNPGMDAYNDAVTVTKLQQPSFLPPNTSSTEQATNPEVDLHFQRAVVMLHARQYEFAIAALEKTLELAPKMPEAYVNMGYALLGLDRYHAASQYFSTAINLRPDQANAYWGLAVSLEQNSDYDAAIGAMRTFIHLSDPAEPFLKKARAAIWEWSEARKNLALLDDE